MSNTDGFLSNEQLLDVLTLNKIATAIHVTEDAVIQYANNAMIKIWGKDKSVIGEKLIDALPELKGQPFVDMFKRVWNEGITISGKDALRMKKTNLAHSYQSCWRFCYSPTDTRYTRDWE